MSTTALTVVVAVTVLFGTAVSAVRTLWGRKAASAAFLAGGFFGVLHLLVLWVAEDAALSATISKERWPGIADLSTWVYDITAWTALAFLAIGVILSVIQWRRRKAAEKELAKALMNFFGVNEDTKPEESEED